MSKMSGGGGNDNPPSFTGLSPTHYYPLNNHNNDPTNANNVYSTRIMPNMAGGKKKFRKSNKRGGSIFSQSPTSFNPTQSIGNIASLTTGGNILTGDMSLKNPSVVDQPKYYGTSYTPLV
jgi:hypothetical protein